MLPVYGNAVTFHVVTMQIGTDSRGRRRFASHAGRIAAGYRPDEAERQWLTFLNVHGLASSDTLFELTRSMTGVRNRHNCSERLLRLWEAGILFKPIGQRATANADANFHVYDLAERGRMFLAREGLWVEALRPSGNFAHQLMVATITATIDIGCRRAGYQYVPPHEYLAGKRLKANVPFDWDDGRHICPLVPDTVFAIDYGNRSFIAYALEADRNTEPLRASSWQRKSDLRMLRQYRNFIGGKQYRQAYGRVANMMLLYVTVSEGHARTFLDLVGEELGAPACVAVGVLESFATPFRPPRLPMHLFDQPLRRAGKEGWRIGQAKAIGADRAALAPASPAGRRA